MDDVRKRVDPIRGESDRDEECDGNSRTLAFQQRRDRGVPDVHSARPPQQAVEDDKPEPRRDQRHADDEASREPLNPRRRPDDHAERSLNKGVPGCCVFARIPRKASRWR